MPKDGPGKVEFVRVAVTEQQIARYAVAETPVKKTDRRGKWVGGTVQVEALAPGDLAAELRAALEAVLDLEVFDGLRVVEAAERAGLLNQIAEVADG